MELQVDGPGHPAGCLVIAGLTTYLFFPETSGIPVEMTHSVFKDHWAWPRMYPEILQVRLLPLALITEACLELFSLVMHVEKLDAGWVSRCTRGNAVVLMCLQRPLSQSWPIGHGP